jgi:DNA-binding cell septation regulator SpoVG
MATDTILRFNTALMKADFEADYYEWTIGDDPRTWNTREVALSFGVQFYMPIPITLKVAKAVDKSCFPNAKDTVTFQRTLVVVPEEDTKVVGRYEGVLLSSPSKPNFLEFKDSIHPRYGDPIYGHSGIIPTCDMPVPTRGHFNVGYRSFYLDTRPTSIGCCFGLNGYGKLQQDGSFSMKLVHHPFNPADSCIWGGIGDPTIIDEFSATKIL